MTDLPPPLTRLIERLYARVDMLTNDLETGTMEPTAWRDSMAAVLAQGHTAAYMAGAGTTELEQSDQRRLMQDLRAQLGFLDNFTVEIQAADEFQKGWNARARMYADAVGMSHYRGQFRMWALPAVPRDGSTQCLSRCNCSWEIVELEGEGNADAYWRLGPSESCQTCVERAAQWSPLKFRGGELQ
jgi:hypothetical protein